MGSAGPGMQMRKPSPSEQLTPSQNRLLAALPLAVGRRLLPRLESVALPAGMLLFRPHGKLRYVYFPVTGVVSLSYGIDVRGATAKAWPIGREGMVGISAFLGAPTRSARAEVQIAGHAFRLDADVLGAEFRRGGGLQELLLRYVQALIAQASQLGICGHYHSLNERLCGFLLRAFDQMLTNELDITQEKMARLLGVRRIGISEVAGGLQAAGIIRYSRGHIHLLNRRKLEARACECHAAIEWEFGRLRPRRTASAFLRGGARVPR